MRMGDLAGARNLQTAAIETLAKEEAMTARSSSPKGARKKRDIWDEDDPLWILGNIMATEVVSKRVDRRLKHLKDAIEVWEEKVTQGHFVFCPYGHSCEVNLCPNHPSLSEDR